MSTVLAGARIALDCRYIQDHFPGIGRYTYELARRLPTLAPGCQFLLVRNAEARNTRFTMDEVLALPNVEAVTVQAGPFALGQQWELPRMLRRRRAQLYHSPYYVMPYATPCPSVATIHDLIPSRFPESLPQPRLASLFRLLIRLCAWRTDHLIVDSDATLDDLVSDRIAAADGVTRVYLGVEERFRPQSQPAVQAYHARVGLQKPYVLYLGINKPHKNLGALLHAWARLDAGLRQRYTLALAGHQDERYGQGAALVQELGVADSVRLLGGVPEEELPLLYGGAAVFCFASLYEGFGLPILEAMASGTPVACSNVSSMPEVAGQAALLFNPADDGAIADALDRLLTDEALRNTLAAAGRARARSFTWERTATETLAVYRRVLEAGA